MQNKRDEVTDMTACSVWALFAETGDILYYLLYKVFENAENAGEEEKPAASA